MNLWYTACTAVEKNKQPLSFNLNFYLLQHKNHWISVGLSIRQIQPQIDNTLHLFIRLFIYSKHKAKRKICGLFQAAPCCFFRI